MTVPGSTLPTGDRSTRQGFDKVPVPGGTLIYRRHDDGRDLVGFADVEDWDAVRGELARRGHGVGAIHHLPVFPTIGVASDD